MNEKGTAITRANSSNPSQAAARVKRLKPVDPGDGRRRCNWAATDPLLASYHDHEWGVPIKTDSGHLERMALEVFQCGLSWKIVLVKRDALRDRFDGFDVQRVARFDQRRIKRLCSDAAIIRNRAKIEATVSNARVFIELAERHGSYVKWLKGLDASTPRAIAALYPLFRTTFKFMGPETTKCYLMGMGKIAASHDQGCWRE
ncbi:MAG: DNA-3-methyladenine glycosylase I [Phycisphaerae bacterium]|nr:MAG: DNA-3-methyladenine glycosylase I [Planctomycetia bacterium]RIK69973.1 MAG: DNA-3-methyladenine glycosylase I [Planctomycetota bacterium]GJQ27043.1 MAG: DNA-3-methyladenine glycosylase I [Phycisphaerae bacterium]